MKLARPVLLFLLAFVALAACGSDDDSDAGPAGDSETPDDSVTDDGSADDTGAGDDSDAGTGGTSTITVEGTTYELANGDCEGSNTDSSAYPFPDNFSLSGTDIDSDLQFNIARNGPADELFVQVGTLEGDFDENGKNNDMLYNAQMDTLDFTVDGADVSGSVTMRAINPTRPYGDETVVDFDFDC